jgi:hypothetical protein
MRGNVRTREGTYWEKMEWSKSVENDDIHLETLHNSLPTSAINETDILEAAK